MYRVMVILGLLVLVPAALVFWRTRDRASLDAPPPLVPQKVIGTSTLNHGQPQSGKDIDVSPTLSERRP